MSDPGAESPSQSGHGKHILGTFQQAMDDLRAHTLMMFALAVRNFRNALQGLEDRNEDLCKFVIADDEEVDVLEKEVDQLTMRAIVQFHPVAGDLRATLAAPKIAANLEKLADVAVGLAKRARKLSRRQPLDEAALLQPLMQETLALVLDSQRAYDLGETQLAAGLQERHRAIKKRLKSLGEELAESMAAAPHQVESFLDLIFICRFLESAASLARAIGEDSVFMSEARDIRHPRATKFS